MKTSTPVLYCDVDGVINIRTTQLNDLTKQFLHRSVPFLKKPVPLPFRYSPSVVESLTLYPVSFFWLTTWNHSAVKFLEPITKIRSEGVLDFRLTVRDIGKEHGKYKLLKDHQTANPRPFIWVDNVATKNYNPADWEEFKHPHLIIKPETRYGITSDHLAEMEEFINQFS